MGEDQSDAMRRETSDEECDSYVFCIDLGSLDGAHGGDEMPGFYPADEVGYQAHPCVDAAHYGVTRLLRELEIGFYISAREAALYAEQWVRVALHLYLLLDELALVLVAMREDSELRTAILAAAAICDKADGIVPILGLLTTRQVLEPSEQRIIHSMEMFALMRSSKLYDVSSRRWSLASPANAAKFVTSQ